jgi:glycosyltransferase involved in cell wall biosynthesis
VPGIVSKHLDTISHTLVSCLHALFQRYDVVVLCIAGNSPLAIIPKLVGTKVVMNVDGSDWRRRKWSRPARLYLRFAEWLGVHLPHATVTDSEVMRRYYLDTFGAQTTYIGYGGDLAEPEGSKTLDRFGLTPRSYVLLVGRLVPENCAHHLVDAYQQLGLPLRCVVVGDAPYSRKYISWLKAQGPDVLFTGYLFGDGYRELMYNAYAVVLCSEVGGTHPVLVEAMAAGNCVVVNNTPANLEVVGDAGLSYDGARGADSLREVLRWLADNPEAAADFRERARARAREHYTWDAVTDGYRVLFERLTGRGDGARAALPRAGRIEHG